MSEPTTRDAIMLVALELLVRHGYRGMSFGAIASSLGTTRANIHYHFGTKERLVEEVLEDYVEATLAALDAIWGAENRAFGEKLEAMLAFSRERYRHYNPSRTEGRPWSLISRLRQDADLLTPAARTALKRFGDRLTGSLLSAIGDAKARGEFGADMPVEDVALQLVTLADNAAPITLEAGDFARLERLYRGFAVLVDRAYGPDAGTAD